MRIDDNMPSINVNVIIDGDAADGKITNACIHNIILIVVFTIAVTVGLSQTTYTVSEHDSFVQICAELLTFPI